jgi:YtkA-like
VAECCADKPRRLAADQEYLRIYKMKTLRLACAVQAAVVGIAMAGSVATARADIKDYEFQLADQAIKAGPDRIITVRLINKVTGKPVPDAVIFATRLDMAPDGMQEMATKVTPVPGSEPGTYRFKATLSMAGGWQLSLGAKVQGETGTVENKLVIRAEK